MLYVRRSLAICAAFFASNMVLTFHVPIFEIFLEDKKGIGDVASLRLSLHGIILSPGGPPSPKFNRVPLVDVFVIICLFYGKGLLTLCPNLLFFFSSRAWDCPWQSYKHVITMMPGNPCLTTSLIFMHMCTIFVTVHSVKQ